MRCLQSLPRIPFLTISLLMLGLLTVILLPGYALAAMPAAGSTEQQVWQEINQERQKAGQPPLIYEQRLSALATLKAQDMAVNNYFGHNSPRYGSPFQMLKDNGITFSCAAEQLIVAATVEAGVNALLKDVSLRKNIISSQWKQIGIGIANNTRQVYIALWLITPASSPSSLPLPGSTANSPPAPVQSPASQPATATQQSEDEQKMLNLINQERIKNGLAPLVWNEELARVARLKAKDLIDNNYFAHESPTYGSPFAMMQKFGIKYSYAGENLAGAPSVEIAHQALMNSPGHRANILYTNFKQVGIGVLNGSPYGKIFVQMFIG